MEYEASFKVQLLKKKIALDELNPVGNVVFFSNLIDVLTFNSLLKF